MLSWVGPWTFIVVGIIRVAIGTGLTIYGQQLLTAPPPPPVTPRPVLSPSQESLLRAIHKYQVRFAADKLIIARNGGLHFDPPQRNDPTMKDLRINVAVEVLGGHMEPAARNREFELLMNSIPTDYLRHIPEMRMDSPFVVTITEAGVRYVRER